MTDARPIFRHLDDAPIQETDLPDWLEDLRGHWVQDG
jgi:hypothetical protein